MVKASKAKRALFKDMNRVLSRPKVKTSIVKEIRKQITKSKENKFLDTTLGFNFDTTMEVPSTGQLALIPQDDTASGREGRQVQLNSLWMKMQVTYTVPVEGVGQPKNGIGYLWLVVDHSPNKATASIDGAGIGIFTTNDARTCQLNMFNDNRYTILKKWNIICPENGSLMPTTTTGTVAIRYIEEYIKFKKPIVQLYDNSVATGAITSLLANSLFLVAGSDTLNDDQMRIDGSARLRFTEK